MSTTPFRLTRAKLLPAIRKAAEDSSNVVFVPPTDKAKMTGMVNHLQMLKALREGDMIGQPQLNEHGHWACRIQHLNSAWTKLVDLRVMVECSGINVQRLIVIWDPDDE